ncbi:neuraminidase-like domain-containing protein [Nocardia sp. CA-129566]|uniref:Tc toxin subunit A-related protein n=1 Tax=Nocardia sp. CA-129566 TaxID=3239976 RepID=UPI003D97C403
MPDLIILRLAPSEPMAPNDFKTILADLKITAYDSSFADSVRGALLGKAAGLADPHLASTVDNSVDINNTQILQHYIDAADPPDPLGPPKPTVRRLESAATAVIVVDPAHTSAEYPTSTSYDLRLELSKGSLVIAQRRVHYNVAITTQGTLSTDQTDYFHASASAFVTLPASAAGRDPNLAFVDLPPDGQAPLFSELVKAIDKVLAKDPGGATGTLLDAAPLTPAQCRQIANEIVWNRTAFPPPQPDPTLGFDPFGALYTKPKVDPYISDDNIEKARGRFDAELNGYYGTHEAEALRLAGFVYSAAAAIAEERLSIAASRARFDFPLITGAGTATTIPTAGVVLTEATEKAGLKPSFVVPAAYFYALTAQVPSQVGPEQRFDMARLTLEPQLLTAIEVARDSGVITTPAAPSTVSGAALTAIQVARRLHALGGTSGLAEVPLAAPIDALITDWLAHDKPTATIDADFWQPEATTKRPAAYLELLLLAVTGHSADLITALKQPPLGIDTVAKLVAVTDKQWREFFAARADLLPPFTAPGTPAERTEAFIRHLRRFFTVNKDPGNAQNPGNAGPPMLGRSGRDVFAAFANTYPSHSGGTAFTFAADLDPAALAATVTDVLPEDPAAQRWLTFALNAIRQLWVLTDIGAQDLRFSLMEALYARGFTDAVHVARLSLADFGFALSGSVAYNYAAAIYHQASEFEPYPPAPPGPFQPVNPDGSLIDCIPPEHLSPLGPVAYLHELLQVSAGSTCEDPRGHGEEADLGALLAARRGPVGQLHATEADLTTQIPVIDLVNESLEALVTRPTDGSGAVYDTAAYELAGHRLSTDGSVGGDPWAHDSDTLFAALPQHSSPATPVEVPAAYDVLRSDFTDPALPYPQALDINRSYLEATGSSRYSAMRHFRRDITEFAIDAEYEPDTYVRHQWRFPLRLPLVLEYLRITPEESELLYRNDIADAATPGRLVLREVYGFPADQDGEGDEDWLDVVRRVPEFLRRTGLDYCEFLALWECGFVPFGPDGGSGSGSRDGEGLVYPPCQPCCPDDLTIDFGDHSTTDALRRLAVFIRLWRRLRENPVSTVTFDELSDICTVLELFHGPKINPQFLRQLCALFVLRELLCLPLADPDATDPSGTGADRTHLLALWLGPDAQHWNWALRTLIDGIEGSAERVRPELADQPELAKLMAQNLAPLSRLAGFNPDVATDTWYGQPTSTLRFAEVLLKIYLSEFTVGEVLFLFADAHLDGDDPFPLPTPNESLDDPLGLPDDEDGHGLWALRRQLLEVTADDAGTWTLSRIGAALTDEFGYLPTVPADSLRSLAERFFPSVLECEGTPVPADRRRFATPLAAADTTPAMWNAEPSGPLHYDIATQTLWTQLPLDDAALAQRLSHLRPLTEVERKAVSELYFMPRAALVPFALLFGSFEVAVHTLVHEPDEQTRFAFVQREFALFHRRCKIIAEHLADHVRAAAPQGTTEVGAVEVARLLRALHGDENTGHTPWEDDSGKPPVPIWPTAPTGGAYAALLGLLGTGLLGEFSVAGNAPAWRELSGPLSMFDAGRNEWNAPVPTVIPTMDLTLSPEQLRLVAVRNGFALRDEDGEPLFGAQPFTVTWSGSLVVENGGRYEFAAGGPTPDGEAPDCDRCDDLRWRITLRRGQRSWILLNHNWPGEDAADYQSTPIELRGGAYEITVEFDQREPRFDEVERVRPRHTGFQVKYTGPDTGDTLVAVPHHRLYRNTVDIPLDECVDVDGAAHNYLHGRYTSSLRDIRRTYQRAFKSVLIAHRLGLSAATLPREPQSELGYLLDHPEAVAGQTYPRTGPSSFGTHRAWFDLDLLPVTDPYRSPTNDQRAGVSGRRQAALFDWWERLYDYTGLRAETKAARERPAWRVFLEAAERQPDDPAQLVRHLGVDVRHAPLVLTYFAVGGDYHIATPDLESEAWVARVWRGEMWLDRLEHRFRVSRIEDAKPARWASDRPELAPDAGNDNLTRFVQDGCFENDSPRRYLDVQALNDGLRVRARDALVAWLCGMNRVPLPFAPGRFATRARDLSDLLLQDVETGTGERASRIQDAISSAQAFVQRARLGLEPGLAVTAEFAEVWDGRFESFLTWQCIAEREQYRENWIEWDELAKARRVEAFTLLEAELRRRRLTVAVPGGTEWWPGRRPPAHPGLTASQAAEAARISLLLPGPLPEGMDLLGEPADARLSWLAPVMRALPPGDGDGGSDGGDGNADGASAESGTVKARGRTKGAAAKARGGGGAAKAPGGGKGAAKVRAANGESAAADAHTGNVVREAARHGVLAGELSDTDHERLPMWIKAAARLGTRFVRVAAAGLPPAGAGFVVCEHDSLGRCVTCAQTAESVVDEYYFWLQDARSFDAVHQDADAGRGKTDEISDWHRPEKLPALLDWPTGSVVHLVWSRARDGRFEPSRRSTDPVVLDPQAVPKLVFTGRAGDSLRFQVIGGHRPKGHEADPTPPGFRYDLATDSAITVPQLAAPPAVPPGAEVGGLDGYPFFAYVCPGAPLEPLTLFSVATTVGGALRADCKFDAALKWYELVRIPGATDNTWSVCVNTAADEHSDGDSDSADGEVELALSRRDQTCCPTGPVDGDRARDRALLLRYLETMLAWADVLRCRNNPEATRRAEVVLTEVDRILGARPEIILAQDDSTARTVSRFIPRRAPLNPRLLALYDRTADRLAAIRECVNGRRLRDGTPGIDMRYFGDDPRRDGWQLTGCACGSEGCCEPCCEPYRFTVLVQRARELAGEVRALGGQLLAAHEKADAEYLAALRQTQERQLVELTLDQRRNQWRDADWQVQALGKTKEGAQTRLRYYQNLIVGGLNSGESGYEALTGVALGSRIAGNVLEAIAQGVSLFPDLWIGIAGIAGTPLMFSQWPVGNKLGAGFSTAARILNAVSDNANTAAGLSNTEGSWDRRLADWRQQVDVISVEIEQIERQILGAERRRDMALTELNTQRREVENAARVQDFLRDKFTSHEMYLYLQQETSAQYFRMYELARCAARKAERAFNYERGHTTRSFVGSDDFDNLRAGLMAGERLQLAVAQMDKAYLDENCREYELTKHISLRQAFPLAFVHLQATGYAEIELPEWLFDVDYPGHYLRRIKNVTVTIPCVVGPYTGVHCRLTLLSSHTRVDPRLAQTPAVCCDKQSGSDCGCISSDNGYAAAIDDGRVLRSYAATEAIATSSGQNDSGMFELNFHDERYLPFEFAGAVGRWRIELPPETNYFDFDALSDVVLHLNYTAREGGEALRTAALSAAQCRLPGDGLRLFDLRRDLPDAWQGVSLPKPAQGPWNRKLDLRLSGSMFPFVPAKRARWAHAIQLFIEAPCAEPSTNIVLKFRPGLHDHGEAACQCRWIDVHCVASSEYPALYWGVVDLDGSRLGPLQPDRPELIGTVELPDDLGEVCDAKVVIGYCAEPWRSCGHGDRCSCRGRY